MTSDTKVNSKLRAFGGKVTVIDPPVTSVRRPSGIYIPEGFGVPVELSQGIVVNSPKRDDVEVFMVNLLGSSFNAALDNGTLVYYIKNRCFTIGDIKVVPLEFIVATESLGDE